MTEISLAFNNASKQISGEYLKVGRDHFLLRPLQFLVHYISHLLDAAEPEMLAATLLEA
jgi:hypothetical protein